MAAKSGQNCAREIDGHFAARLDRKEETLLSKLRALQEGSPLLVILGWRGKRSSERGQREARDYVGSQPATMASELLSLHSFRLNEKLISLRSSLSWESRQIFDE